MPTAFTDDPDGGERWFRTGDLGFVDDDGYVTLTGRLKDIIIRKGENISAKEIEDLLFAHPKVVDVAVVGVPDAASGERACAVVVVAPGETFTFLEMTEHLTNADLTRQKIPEQLEVVDALPRERERQGAQARPAPAVLLTRADCHVASPGDHRCRPVRRSRRGRARRVR